MSDEFPVPEGYDWATAWFTSADELTTRATPFNKPFGVEIDGLVFACQFRKYPGARRIVVSLNGSTGSTMTRPVFIRRNWADDLEAHMLVISDPSLLLEETLRTGIFLGTEDKYPMDGVIAISNAIAKTVRLDPKTTVFWGSSSGGFASVIAAARTGAGAIALNPQLDLAAAGEAADSAIICKMVRPGLSPEGVGFHFPTRAIAYDAVDEAHSKGLEPRLVIMQNTDDRHHYKHHFLPFCRSFEIPTTGGVDPTGKMVSYLYRDPRGHMSETVEIKAHLKSALRFASGVEPNPPPQPAFAAETSSGPIAD